MRLLLKRVYLPVNLWEEVTHNMWGDVEDRYGYLQRAIEFTGDHKRYGDFMLRVIREWSVSCENALTDYSLNRRAWVGHAAAALAMKCPEDITRLAWGYLNDEQQLLANQAADRAIHEWTVNYAKDKGIHPDMGSAVLPGWNT